MKLASLSIAALPLGVPCGGSESPFAPYLFLMDLTGSERAVKTIVAALPESASSSRKPEDSGTGGDKSADKPSDR